MSTENKAVAKLETAWKDFTEANDKRLDEIKKDGEATYLTTDAFKKAEKAFDEAQTENSDLHKAAEKRMDELELEIKRPGRHQEDEDGTQEERDHLSAFNSWLRAPDDPEVCIAVKQAERKEFSARPDAMKVVGGAGTAGGNAIPTLVAGIIANKIKDKSPLRQLARVVSSANELTRFLVSDNNSTAGWVGQGDSRTATVEPRLESAVPTYGTAYGYTAVYEEALHDLSINVGSWLQDDIINALSAQEGAAFVAGNGTNKPTGFIGTPVATVDEGVSPERAFGVIQYIFTGIAADFQGDRLSSPLGNPGDVFLDTIYALKKEYRAAASWLMNRTVLASVRKFKDADGDYLYRPNFQGGMGDLFGFVVHEDENMADVGANTFPAAIGDWHSGYLIADIVNSLRVTLDDNITAPGTVKFYSRRRLGGITYNDDAIKIVKCATS